MNGLCHFSLVSLKQSYRLYSVLKTHKVYIYVTMGQEATPSKESFLEQFEQHAKLDLQNAMLECEHKTYKWLEKLEYTGSSLTTGTSGGSVWVSPVRLERNVAFSAYDNASGGRDAAYSRALATCEAEDCRA